LLEDIRRLPASKLLRQLGLKRGQLDLLAGCPPCQSFSALKTLNGYKTVRDKRNKDLLFQILKFVRVFNPKAVILENSPRLARDPRIYVLSTLLRRLGYSTRRKVLN